MSIFAYGQAYIINWINFILHGPCMNKPIMTEFQWFNGGGKCIQSICCRPGCQVDLKIFPIWDLTCWPYLQFRPNGHWIPLDSQGVRHLVPTFGQTWLPGDIATQLLILEPSWAPANLVPWCQNKRLPYGFPISLMGGRRCENPGNHMTIFVFLKPVGLLAVYHRNRLITYVDQWRDKDHE